MKRRISLVPFAIVIFLFLLLNRYVLSGLQTISSNPSLVSIFWGFIFFLAGALLYAISRFQNKGVDVFFNIITHTFLMLIVGELVFMAVLLLDDGYRIAIASLHLFDGQSGNQFPIRNTYVVGFGLLLFAITILIFIYGISRGKYAYRIIKHTLYFDDLPESFDGFKITQISDVHAGSFTNAKAVQKGINLIKKQQSDLFVFTGDLVNNKASEITPWIDYFSQVKAPFGQFSILGNHDYGDYISWKNELEKSENLKQLKDFHTQLGYRLLLDEHVEIHKNGEKIILAGIENWGLGFGQRGDLKKAFSGVENNTFKILLSHDPSHWEAEVKTNPFKIQLTLAGHTHGMQFGLEAFGIKWSPVKYRYAHWAGITSLDGRYLNINRGFGFIGFSGRIGIWPEITVIELKRAQPSIISRKANIA